jgi:hypothetical protein
MMMQSYVGETDGWDRLLGFFDDNLSLSLSLEEITVVFENDDIYSLRFDQVRFDDGAAGTFFEQRAYGQGLQVGSPVPDLTLENLTGTESVNLGKSVHQKPMALIFGSYT